MNAPIAPAMLAAIMNDPAAFDPSARGLMACYRFGEVNHCGGCGRCHWLVGRMLAECAFCGTAVPLERPHETR